MTLTDRLCLCGRRSSHGGAVPNDTMGQQCRFELSLGTSALIPIATECRHRCELRHRAGGGDSCTAENPKKQADCHSVSVCITPLGLNSCGQYDGGRSSHATLRHCLPETGIVQEGLSSFRRLKAVNDDHYV